MQQQYGKWKALRQLGKGGQGTVYLASDTSKFDPERFRRMIVEDIRQVVAIHRVATQLEAAEKLARTILQFGTAEDPQHCGALKVLHATQDTTEYAKQSGRMKNELAALRALSHPAIAKIFDENLKEGWFVTEYFPDGPLSEHLDRYRGRVPEALAAFRRLVDGVPTGISGGGRIQLTGRVAFLLLVANFPWRKQMAHFGYFTSPGGNPAAEFEGDYLQMDKQFVQVWKIDPDGRRADTMVAGVHLDKGQYVKELSQ